MAGFVLTMPVHATVRRFGFSSVPQETSAGGTGASSVPGFQNSFGMYRFRPFRSIYP